jgi:hypothetical protein
MRSEAELNELLEQLRSGRVSGDTYALIHEFGEAGLLAAEPTVASYLASPEADLRLIALSVLVLHWRRNEYRGTAEQMLNDPDPGVRRMAVDALAVLTGRNK